VDYGLLAWCRAHQRTDPRVRAALASQHATTWAIYRFARDGIAMLHPVSRPCVATALTLYSEILNRIEDSDFAVFAHRARVGQLRRVGVAVPALARAFWARRGGHRRHRGGPVPTRATACLAVTAPLEMLGARVYRQPARLARAVLPVAVVFLVWDAFAIAGRVWTYNPRYVTGVRLPFRIPVEELVFFMVIPVCGILTYACVQAMGTRWRARRAQRAQHSQRPEPAGRAVRS
jgi:lycopene cyclase domain-containing protein